VKIISAANGIVAVYLEFNDRDCRFTLTHSEVVAMLKAMNAVSAAAAVKAAGDRQDEMGDSA
jgi:hypothetical protein